MSEAALNLVASAIARLVMFVVGFVLFAVAWLFIPSIWGRTSSARMEALTHSPVANESFLANFFGLGLICAILSGIICMFFGPYIYKRWFR